MYKRLLAIAAVLLIAGSFNACSILDAEKTPPKDEKPDPPKEFGDLTQREHVLENLELAYNERDIVEYERLLDPDVFTFFFSDVDFGEGRTPEFWGREDEVRATGRMFDENYDGANRITSIDLKLDQDVLTWQEIIPENFPDEKWFSVVVAYDYTIQAEPDQTWITSGVPQTVYTVRNVGDDENPQWRLVEWRDLGS